MGCLQALSTRAFLPTIIPGEGRRAACHPRNIPGHSHPPAIPSQSSHAPVRTGMYPAGSRSQGRPRSGDRLDEPLPWISARVGSAVKPTSLPEIGAVGAQDRVLIGSSSIAFYNLQYSPGWWADLMQHRPDCAITSGSAKPAAISINWVARDERAPPAWKSERGEAAGEVVALHLFTTRPAQPRSDDNERKVLVCT